MIKTVLDPEIAQIYFTGKRGKKDHLDPEDKGEKNHTNKLAKTSPRYAGENRPSSIRCFRAWCTKILVIEESKDETARVTDFPDICQMTKIRYFLPIFVLGTVPEINGPRMKENADSHMRLHIEFLGF